MSETDVQRAEPLHRPRRVSSVSRALARACADVPSGRVPSTGLRSASERLGDVRSTGVSSVGVSPLGVVSASVVSASVASASVASTSVASVGYTLPNFARAASRFGFRAAANEEPTPPGHATTSTTRTTSASCPPVTRPGGSEKRREDRVARSVPIQLMLREDGVLIVSTTADISMGGAFVRVHRKLQINARVEVQLRPNRDRSAVQLQARVVRMGHKDGRRGVALAFEPGQHEAIEQILQPALK